MAFRLSETERFWLSELVAAKGKTKTEVVVDALRLAYAVEKAAIIQPNPELAPVIQQNAIISQPKTQENALISANQALKKRVLQ